MTRCLGLLSLVAIVSLTSGCAMCCHPYDYAYLYQGGAWQRNDPEFGRVGSAFTPEVGTRVVAEQVVSDGAPTPAGRGATPAKPARPRTQAGESYLPSR